MNAGAVTAGARGLERPVHRGEAGTGEWLTSQKKGELKSAATDMTLRALRAAADPTNFAILTFLSAQTSAPMADLEKSIGLGRLALNERVNDLVQVGLAGRNIDTDQVQATAAGSALVGLIDSIGEAAAKKLAEQLQTPKVKPQTADDESSD